MNPVGYAVRGLRTLRTSGVDSVFSRDRYELARARFAKDPTLLTAEVTPHDAKDVEFFLAHLDARLESFGFPTTTPQILGGKKIESVSYIREIERTLWLPDTPGETVLDRLTRLYYGATHAIPYDINESFLRLPNQARDEIMAFEMDRLVLRHALFEVMNLYGINFQLRTRSFWSETQRILYAALITPPKIFGYVDTSTRLARFAYNPEFYSDVLTQGYLPTLTKWRPKLESQLGKTLKFETFLGLSGAAFSTFFTLRLAYRLTHKKPTESEKKKGKPRGAPDLRRYLYESWLRIHRRKHNSEPDSTTDAIQRKFFETADEKELNQIYDSILHSEEGPEILPDSSTHQSTQ